MSENIEIKIPLEPFMVKMIDLEKAKCVRNRYHIESKQEYDKKCGQCFLQKDGNCAYTLIEIECTHGEYETPRNLGSSENYTIYWKQFICPVCNETIKEESYNHSGGYDFEHKDELTCKNCKTPFIYIKDITSWAKQLSWLVQFARPTPN
jgi:hypothetical protein